MLRNPISEIAVLAGPDSLLNTLLRGSWLLANFRKSGEVITKLVLRMISLTYVSSERS